VKWPWYSRKTRERVARTFVSPVTWERNEELRPERLGPGVDDLELRDVKWEPPNDPWRPKRTLGPF
jgi:hypothetical protein